ncbi:tetratricopeptide repeat protein [Thermogemmatispora sp.]|uniref:tetratricopeptide repeat protein n=1 Tax=Thermogemmatispora sp. TaxID=1968838 RepID=UPI001D6E7051|nr:tetratricopeptide repeat protein [Thermogemmatispora sp.]MBX5449292.1 tetratricopeptide repeat protein [Thermogemmatispora sp.]
MARKKDIASPVSVEDQARLQSLLTQVSSLVEQLRSSQSQQEIEAALAPITSAPVSVQLALVKELAQTPQAMAEKRGRQEQASEALASVGGSRWSEQDAADLLQALYHYSPEKECRKEAKRSLIRLEGVRIYPQWQPPREQPTAFQSHPPRFWKGLVSQTREQGEVQLFLGWEEGYDYNEARLIALSLDFWQQGVRDCQVERASKRRIESRLTELTARLEEARFCECTLAEGRRLLEEALGVSRWRKQELPEGYRYHAPLIRQLLLEAPEAEVGEDRGLTFIQSSLDPEELALTFIGAWSLGDFGLAYDLLTPQSPLREGLSRDEWIERRRAWANEAQPARLTVSFVTESEQPQSGLWLPGSTLSSRGPRKLVEIGWSLELSETPLSGTLPEMAMGTAVNKETGRHWFWTSYTLLRQEEAWRIHTMTDEGARAQGLPIPELQQRIKEHDDRVREISAQQREALLKSISLLDRPDPQVLLEEVTRRLTQAMHYDDALMVRLSLDQQVVENAYNHAAALRNGERAMVYLERLAQRFPGRRADALRELAMTEDSLATLFEQQGLKERSQRFDELAEQHLQESLSLRPTALGYALLAQMKLQHRAKPLPPPEVLQEAEELLAQAQALTPNRAEETIIEAALGTIASARGEQSQALQHYERAASLSPDYPGIWLVLSHTQRALGRRAEARESLQRALRYHPADLQAYSELVDLAVEERRFEEARTVLEEGLKQLPQSAHLRALLAMVLTEQGELRQAQRFLEEAERLDRRLPSVQAAREMLSERRKQR